jgi:glutamate racemase
VRAPRYLYIGPTAEARALWEAAAGAGAVEADPDLWALHDIRAGIPTVWPETADAFVPQMANMQRIDGVSFHKGCYTGQEVVARMQYLGKLKRRMYLAEVSATRRARATPPPEGRRRVDRRGQQLRAGPGADRRCPPERTGPVGDADRRRDLGGGARRATTRRRRPGAAGSGPGLRLRRRRLTRSGRRRGDDGPRYVATGLHLAAPSSRPNPNLGGDSVRRRFGGCPDRRLRLRRRRAHGARRDPPRPARRSICSTSPIPATPPTVSNRSPGCCERAERITDFLIERGAKAIVIACNTATGVAAAQLRAHYDLPIIAMEPAVKPAAGRTESGVIGVLATSGTLASEKFEALRGRFHGPIQVLTQPCPGLVELIEAGDFQAGALRALLADLVLPLVERGADTLVLGCTHYPLVRGLIADIAGPDVTITDAGAAVARQVRHRLGEAGRLRVGADPGRERFWSSADASAPAAALIGSLWRVLSGTSTGERRWRLHAWSATRRFAAHALPSPPRASEYGIAFRCAEA